MYIILKKVSVKDINKVLEKNFKINNSELQNKLDANEQSLIKRIEFLEKTVNKSFKTIETLKKENSQQKNQLLNVETMLKDIHYSIVGNKNFCPICNSELPTFIPGGVDQRENAMCPKCGSLERNRAVYLFLKEETNIFDKKIKMLHFAPEIVLAEIFSKMDNIEYLPVDINPDMHDVKEKMDIQDIKYEDNTFDIIYCSHVLEHVSNDKKAMEELYRVLKPGGKAIIQVPLNPNYKETYEDPSFNTPELRLKHYGQSDHVRHYGLDFKEKLENVGFKVSDNFIIDMDEKSVKKYGITNENLFDCTK